jgi:hypothetical protein
MRIKSSVFWILLLGLLIVVAALSLSGCWSEGGGTFKPPPGKAGLRLEYNHAYDKQGDDLAPKEDIPILWEGSRVLGAEEGATTGDAFIENDSYPAIPSDPWWTAKELDVNPGNWNLSVTVKGNKMTCPSPIALAEGVNKTVTFQINKESGQFDGCTF